MSGKPIKIFTIITWFFDIVNRIFAKAIRNERKEEIPMQMQEIRNPHDHNRLAFNVDEKNRIVERFEKGWITRVEFKDNSTVDISHYRKEKMA
jgi:hypothetical protein